MQLLFKYSLGMGILFSRQLQAFPFLFPFPVELMQKNFNMKWGNLKEVFTLHHYSVTEVITLQMYVNKYCSNANTVPPFHRVPLFSFGMTGDISQGSHTELHS